MEKTPLVTHHGKDAKNRFFLKIFMENVELHFPFFFIYNIDCLKKFHKEKNPIIPIYSKHTSIKYELADYSLLPIKQYNKVHLNYKELNDTFGGQYNYYITSNCALYSMKQSKVYQPTPENPLNWLTDEDTLHLTSLPLGFIFKIWITNCIIL